MIYHYYKMFEFLNEKFIYLFNYVVNASSNLFSVFGNYRDVFINLFGLFTSMLGLFANIQKTIYNEYIINFYDLLCDLINRYFTLHLNVPFYLIVITVCVIISVLFLWWKQNKVIKQLYKQQDDIIELIETMKSQTTETNHKNVEPLSARTIQLTSQEILAEVNKQLNKRQSAYEKNLATAFDKIESINTKVDSVASSILEVTRARAWKLSTRNDKYFNMQLSRDTKQPTHITYLHINFAESLKFLPRMDQLFDLLVELRRQATNDYELNCNWYLALINANSKQDEKFIDTLGNNKQVQIFDLYTNFWDTIINNPFADNNTIFQPASSLNRSQTSKSAVDWSANLRGSLSRLKNYTPMWCNCFHNSNTEQSGIFIMLFTEHSIDDFMRTR